MSPFIQTLEQRMFLSVSSTTLSADLATVRTTAATVHGDSSSGHSTRAAAVKTLDSDVRALKVTSNNKLLAKLQLDDVRNIGKSSVAESVLLSTGKSGSALVAAEGTLLLRHPSTKLAARISTDSANLNAKVASRQATLLSDVSNWQTQLDADLNGIQLANPSSSAIAADVSRLETGIASEAATYTAAVNAFKASVTTLTTDAASISG